MHRRPRLTVIGSLNMDISVSVGRLPGPGETVLGTGAVIAPGGKGANQALAAARLGGAVRMAGCVGDDEFGGRVLAALAAEGVDLAPVRAVPGCATGLALITVDAAGENMITVAPGANGQAGEQEAAAALSAPADMLVLSAEIPAALLAAVLGGSPLPGGGAPLGRSLMPGGGALPGGGAGRRLPCLVNLAPVPRDAAALLAAGIDWLVVNESEASQLLGRSVAGLSGAAAAASGLVAMGAGHAVVTAGSHGAALAGEAGTESVPGFSVRSVDSVGAGDAFVAALGVTLAAGIGPAAALRAACAAGATATTRQGAQAALPRPTEIRAATGEDWPIESG
jgi:ribokinase